jgi:AbrB family looped-hinge helix DNA binding protein
VPPHGSVFTEPFFGKEKLNGKKLGRSFSSRAFSKIDDRGRIYLPAKLRRFYKSVSFSADLANRRVFLSANGIYSIDSKGRVSVPADIRRSLGINSGSVITLATRLPTKSLSRIPVSCLLTECVSMKMAE